MSLPVPISDPQPPEASQERRWAGEGGAGRALPVWQLRMLAAVMAAFHAMGMVGFFAPVVNDGSAPSSSAGLVWKWLIVGIGVSIASAIAAVMTRSALKAKPIGSSDCRLLVLLLVLPVLVNVLLSLVLLCTTSEPRFFIGVLVIGTAVLAVFACLPVYILLRRFRVRLGDSDAVWTPHRASNGGRCDALIGLSVLVGGWTAFGGALTMSITDPWGLISHGPSTTKTSFLAAFGVGVLAQPVGMLLGAIGCVVVAVVPVGTRTDRSVPLIFLPVFFVGVLGSLFDPLLGIFAAGTVAVLMTIVAWRTCRIIPPGRCQKCAYDLADNATGVCPECGVPVASDTVWPFRT